MSTTCPRCGYDLSAIPPTWMAHCPLGGTCSECGLEFAWGSLLNPRLLADSTFFEHAKHRRTRAFCFTLARAFLPRRFWSSVRIESPIRAARAVLFVVLAVAIGTLLMLAVLGVLHASGLGWPPQSLRDLRDRPAESAGELAGEFAQVVVPLFEVKSWNRYQGRWPVVYAGFGGFRMWLEPLPTVAAAATMLMPIAFLTLPVTLRRCRVRRAHLVRVWWYGLPLALLLLQLPLLLVWVRDEDWIRFMQVASAPVWQLLWWWAAVKHYLRLPHAWAVSAAMTIISFLSVLLILAVLAGDWLLVGPIPLLGPWH